VVDQEIHKNEEECERFKLNAENALHEIFLAVGEMKC
jgi:hypothetical protein